MRSCAEPVKSVAYTPTLAVGISPPPHGLAAPYLRLEPIGDAVPRGDPPRHVVDPGGTTSPGSKFVGT